MRLALVAVLALVSCSNGPPPGAIPDERVVTTPGGSCGEWYEHQGNPPVQRLVDAVCGEGLSCVGIAYYDYEPTDLAGRWFRTCLPADALTCSIPSPPCPEPFVCALGAGLPSSGACIHTCTTHPDCPDTYQVCHAERCMVVPCEMPPDGGNSCWAGEHCQDRICRPD